MPIHFLEPEQKKLISLLMDYYEAGDCECKKRGKCVRCKLWEQIGNLPEAQFNELRKEIE